MKLLMFKLSFLFFLQLISVNSICQSKQQLDFAAENMEKIKSRRTPLSKLEIEKLLCGKWDFICLKTSEGVKIDTLKIKGYKDEIPVRPNLEFLPNKRYHIFEKEKTAKGDGAWFFDNSTKNVMLEYDKPYFPPSIDSLMKTTGLKLPGLKDEGFWINKITTDELFIIEFYPVDDWFAQWFNLRYYKKNCK